jgi:hypothetical protein
MTGSSRRPPNGLPAALEKLGAAARAGFAASGHFAVLFRMAGTGQGRRWRLWLECAA